MATLKLDLIRPLQDHWYADDSGAPGFPAFCSSGFDEAFGETRRSRCTLEVRTANPRKKGWIKITLTYWGDGTRVFLPGGGAFGLMIGAITAARVAGLIPLNCAAFGVRHLWARATYRKAKRSPR